MSGTVAPLEITRIETRAGKPPGKSSPVDELALLIAAGQVPQPDQLAHELTEENVMPLVNASYKAAYEHFRMINPADVPGSVQPDLKCLCIALTLVIKRRDANWRARNAPPRPPEFSPPMSTPLEVAKAA